MTDKKQEEAPKAPAKKIQGRVADERETFRRAGYVFTRAWVTLNPQPNAQQLGILKKEPAIKIREV